MNHEFCSAHTHPEQIQQIKEYLKEKNERNYILFVMGINTGLRISDILKLKVGDVQGSHISMREMKTGKQKRIQITSSLKRELKWFNEGREVEEYLLKSRKGKNRPIGRSMAYKILKSIVAEFDWMKSVHIHSERPMGIICTCRRRI